LLFTILQSHLEMCNLFLFLWFMYRLSSLMWLYLLVPSFPCSSSVLTFFHLNLFWYFSLTRNMNHHTVSVIYITLCTLLSTSMTAWNIKMVLLRYDTEDIIRWRLSYYAVYKWQMEKSILTETEKVCPYFYSIVKFSAYKYGTC
jgi:hypothetical protein